MNFKYLFLLFFLPVSIGALGQSREYSLVGSAHIKDGENCNYKITFTISGHDISGYSVTSYQDGQELTAHINGSINRKKHTLSFKESNLSTGEAEACLFNTTLVYKTEGDHISLNGDFIGVDIYNKYCGEGAISFNITEKPQYLFEKPKPKPAPKHVDSVAAPAPLVFRKVKSGEQETLDWKTDTCTLEIWDGEEVDGDIVTIFCNNRKILENYSLLSQKKTLKIPVTAGTTTLTLRAENEGQAPPNTSQVVITDGNTHYSFLVCLQTGKMANLVLKRK